MPYWSFREFAERRDTLDETRLSKFTNRILGRKDDEPDNQGVAKLHAMRHKDELGNIVYGGSDAIRGATGLATNIATGNC